jgi:succinate-semialdehyde dehydrogenase/glutarate-semialdehyde dehydrogenase
VVNLVTGPAAPITEALLDAYEVRAITFTGSTPVGKMLYTRSAQTMKRLALELGGAAPFIVCADADLSLALDQAVIAKFRNYGQSCVGANIFYVDQSQYSAFVDGFSARVKALKPGDPLQPETTFGPLINAKRVQAIRDLQKAGEEAGFEHIASAPSLSNGPTPGLSPELYFPPALYAVPALDRVDQAFLNQEIFGPLAYVVGYSDLDELLGRLCQNPLGLAGYVFSENTAQALRVASRLELGITGVNDGLPSAANVPMGGVKDSGLGREGGHQGIEEFMDIQYIALGKPLLS